MHSEVLFSPPFDVILDNWAIKFNEEINNQVSDMVTSCVQIHWKNYWEHDSGVQKKWHVNKANTLYQLHPIVNSTYSRPLSGYLSRIFSYTKIARLPTPIKFDIINKLIARRTKRTRRRSTGVHNARYRFARWQVSVCNARFSLYSLASQTDSRYHRCQISRYILRGFEFVSNEDIAKHYRV